VAAHSTGVGKAMLAGLPGPEVRALATRTGLVPVTEHTVTGVDELLERLDAVRVRGFALDEEEQELGVRCVAVAVPGEGPLLAVSVSGPG
jgi:IclR family transcriptional regulator, acetate operon repressor